MAKEIARDLAAGKVVCVVVTTQEVGRMYLTAIAKAGGARRFKGKVLILCASESNGPAYLGYRFDAVHVDLEAATPEMRRRGEELTHAVAARTFKGPTS